MSRFSMGILGASVLITGTLAGQANASIDFDNATFVDTGDWIVHYNDNVTEGAGNIAWIEISDLAFSSITGVGNPGDYGLNVAIPFGPPFNTATVAGLADYDANGLIHAIDQNAPTGGHDGADALWSIDYYAAGAAGGVRTHTVLFGDTTTGISNVQFIPNPANNGPGAPADQMTLIFDLVVTDGLFHTLAGPNDDYEAFTGFTPTILRFQATFIETEPVVTGDGINVWFMSQGTGTMTLVVPGPGSLALLALAGFGARRTRRRQQ